MRAVERGTEPRRLATLRRAQPDRKWDSGGEAHTHRQISVSLIAAQSGMCAYCESPISLEDHAIEHVHPKSVRRCAVRPSKNHNYEWTNLFAVCSATDHCDGPKADKHLCETVLFPDVMDAATRYFSINPLSGEFSPDPNLGVEDTHGVDAAIEELALNCRVLAERRLGVIEALGKMISEDATVDAALAAHTLEVQAFATTIDLFLS